MLSISISFSRPWYLLLLILFFALTVIPYFTLSKKYRKTRNRITSMVLHAIVSLLIVLMLSGISFVRTLANPNNEVIFLVDVSTTENQEEKTRDEFIKNAINQCKFDEIKVGIVTFGYDQEYAVPLTRNYSEIYNQYKSADLPDTSATNIAGALNYAKDLFTNGDSCKIVLITDGKETDDNARSVIRGIVAVGITVDTVYIPSSYEGTADLEITNVTLPDYHVNKNEECTITVDIYSNYEGPATFTLYDNDVADPGTVSIDVKEGTQTIEFKHTYTSEGLHELTFKANDVSDLLNENNEYTSYYYLEVFNKVLIIEQEEGSSTALYTMLTENKDYEVTTLNVTLNDLPTSIEQLCEYDEIIMNNIANSDLTEGFDELLNDYVYNYGGGLFTTGGVDQTGEAHAYNRSDMIGTLYQQMLPVQAINYTPPVGVIVIIDRSGSMSTADENGNTLLDWAKAGATSCLNALTERDYFGIMTLESDYDTILELTPRTQESKILAAIDSIDKATGGTVFPGAIDRAGQALRALKNVDKKHIIIVTDGQVPETEVEQYEEYAANYYETDGITISVIGVNMSKPANADTLMNENYDYNNLSTKDAFNKMLRLTKITHGQLHVIAKDAAATLVAEMREDLNAPEIKETNFESYYPTANIPTSSLFQNVTIINDDEHSNNLDMEFTGFNGVKVRASADLLIVGDYNVPIYASWKYGKGTVGSLMVDVNGNWSGNLMTSDDGKQLMFNIINSLTPTENIRSNDIKLVLNEDNYSNTLSIFTDLNEGETIKGSVKYTTSKGEYTLSLNDLVEMDTLTKRDGSCYLEQNLSVDNNYTRCKFIIKDAGAYTIEVIKYDSTGNVIGSNSLIKSFAYSEEFETQNIDTVDYQSILKSIANTGKGSLIADLEDPHEILDSFDTELRKTFDPRFLFAIISICLFLLDIAVRKFKFKWPHEIIKQKRLAKR